MKYMFLVALCVVAASAFVCPPNICDTVRCTAVENCVDGRIRKSFCGCCDVCVKFIQPLAFLGKSCVQIKSDAENSNLLGAFIPRCETDGSFSPVQCPGSVCYCADTDGTHIPGFESAIFESQGMNCNCARHMFVVGQSGIVSKLFRCEPNGNYKQIQ